MRNDLSFSNIRRNAELPAKTRTTKESPLAVQMKKLTKAGHSFAVLDVNKEKISPTVYQTARRLGIKVNVRQEGKDVGIFYAGQAEEAVSTEKVNSHRRAA